MSEQTADLPALTGELVHAFRTLGVRYAAGEGLWGVGRLGATAPTRDAWAERRPQRLGARISQLLADDMALRVFNCDPESTAISRREEDRGRFTGKTYARFKEKPIQGAQITAVTEVSVGRGRVMPLLRLIEFSDLLIPQDSVLSLSDLAEYIQRDQVRLVVS